LIGLGFAFALASLANVITLSSQISYNFQIDSISFPVDASTIHTTYQTSTDEGPGSSAFATTNVQWASANGFEQWSETDNAFASASVADYLYFDVLDPYNAYTVFSITFTINIQSIGSLSGPFYAGEDYFAEGASGVTIYQSNLDGSGYSLSLPYYGFYYAPQSGSVSVTDTEWFEINNRTHFEFIPYAYGYGYSDVPTVPEPACMATMLGALAMFVRRRCR